MLPRTHRIRVRYRELRSLGACPPSSALQLAPPSTARRRTTR